jgi:hypothetical protein
MDGWDELSNKRGVYVDGALSASKRARDYCRQLPQTVRNGKLFVGWMATGLSADRGTGKLMIVQHAGGPISTWLVTTRGIHCSTKPWSLPADCLSQHDSAEVIRLQLCICRS